MLQATLAWQTSDYCYLHWIQWEYVGDLYIPEEALSWERSLSCLQCNNPFIFVGRCLCAGSYVWARNDTAGSCQRVAREYHTGDRQDLCKMACSCIKKNLYHSYTKVHYWKAGTKLVFLGTC